MTKDEMLTQLRERAQMRGIDIVRRYARCVDLQRPFELRDCRIVGEDEHTLIVRFSEIVQIEDDHDG